MQSLIVGPLTLTGPLIPTWCSDLRVHQMAGAPRVYKGGSQTVVLGRARRLPRGTN